MAALLAARRQYLAAAFCLHARAETVRFRAPASARLICALWQNNPPLLHTISRIRFATSDLLFAIRCLRYVIRNRGSVSFTRNGKAIHKPLQCLIPNLVVYSTLARTVKKPARPFGATGRFAGAMEHVSCLAGAVFVQDLANLFR